MAEHKLYRPADSPPPDDRREPINIHPDTRDRLQSFLFRPGMRGVGYTEFIERALNAAEAEIPEVWMVANESGSHSLGTHHCASFGPFPSKDAAEEFADKIPGAYAYDDIVNRASLCGPWIP